MVVRDVAGGARERHGTRHLPDDPDGPPAGMTFGAPGPAVNVEAENFCQLEASLRNMVRLPSV